MNDEKLFVHSIHMIKVPTLNIYLGHGTYSEHTVPPLTSDT